jgi:hypothetical protein
LSVKADPLDQSGRLVETYRSDGAQRDRFVNGMVYGIEYSIDLRVSVDPQASRRRLQRFIRQFCGVRDEAAE